MSVVARVSLALSLVTVASTAATGVATAASTTPKVNAQALYAKALSDARAQRSVALDGHASEEGVLVGLHGVYDAAGAEQTLVLPLFGTAIEVQTTHPTRLYCEALTVRGLKGVFDVTTATQADTKQWFVLPSTDSRYSSLVNSVTTVKQFWGYSALGWGTTATYHGVATVDGVKTIVLNVKANLFSSSSSGLGAGLLYVTDTTTPLPVQATATTTKASTALKFSQWGTATFTVPSTTTDLPQ